ncbi:MAG: hypothetical protein H6730_15370 [Deltaproteobacteria bacterium]|nr:hypothetical protein [Deltaproteobacteria bacterium]
MSTFEKPASSADKFFTVVNELRPPFVIQLLVEGDGAPDPDALYDALEASTAVNPGASLRIEQGERDAKWVIGPPPTLTVLEAPEFEAAHGDDVPFLMWPMDARVGPTCELLSVQGKHKHYLIFRALHAVMDGQGTLAWARDVMRCLRGEAPLGHESPLSVDDLVLRNPKQLKRRPYPGPDALHPFGPPNPQPIWSFHWRRVVADRPLESLATGRIAVALAEQARAGSDEGIVRINLPTDLRSHCPEERTTGNMFASLYVEVPPGATPEAIAIKVVQLLYKHEGIRPVGLYSTDKSGSLDAIRVKAYWDLHQLHATGLYCFSATLSHLGVLQGALLSGPGFTATGAFFVPLVGDSGCVVSLNGFDDHTEVAVGLSDRFQRDGALDRLAELIGAAVR